MMKKLFLFTLLRCLLVSTAVHAVDTAHARSLTTTCEGKISWFNLSAYTQIDTSEDTHEGKCLFITKSKVGRQILKVCPKESLCSVKANIENASGYYEIKRLISVERIYDTYVEEPHCDLYKDCNPK